MKRLVMRSGACALLAGMYVAWLGLQRRIRAHEQSLKLQVWEAEGGAGGKRPNPNPKDAAYS
jgi:hypothetical protein